MKKVLVGLSFFLALACVCCLGFYIYYEISHRFYPATDVTELEAEKSAREKLKGHCNIEPKCDPSKYFVSARMHGKDPANPHLGVAWSFQFSDSTGPRHTVDICLDRKGNAEYCGFDYTDRPISEEVSWDTGIRDNTPPTPSEIWIGRLLLVLCIAILGLIGAWWRRLLSGGRRA